MLTDFLNGDLHDAMIASGISSVISVASVALSATNSALARTHAFLAQKFNSWLC
jgi:hypothetical protein